ncbi:hypothetical protein, partial [Streptococcus pneumoniae]|uniref:hypothetical protein n=1 Tax=Streptococcus pneumoniae TaxID=1313 RepID=UPI003F698005
ISLVNMAGEEVALENKKLYPVIVDIGTADSLGRIKSTSYGLISIVPKDKDGSPIKNMDDAIIYDNGKEVKAWNSIC